MLRTLFCRCNQVMFQRNAVAWKSNQIILSDSNIVLHILKHVVILKFFSLVLASHTLDHEPITVGGRSGGRRQLLLLPHSGTGTLSICQKLSRSPSEKFSDILKQQRNSFPDCKKSHHLTSYLSKVSTSSHSHPPLGRFTPSPTPCFKLLVLSHSLYFHPCTFVFDLVMIRPSKQLTATCFRCQHNFQPQYK